MCISPLNRSTIGCRLTLLQVINKTFTPLMGNNQTFPTDLAPKLLHRFSSSEGYKIEPNLVSALQALKHQNRQRRFNRIVIGVVTNSDDRVPSILSSFGLKVSPLRYGGTDLKLDEFAQKDYDIDFHCMSYDVGVEKPDSRIFDAAKHMLRQILAIRDGKTLAEAELDVETWRKVYVGDEYAKDVTGAKNAGWNPVLLDADECFTGIPVLDDSPAQALDDLFKENSVVRVHSIQSLSSWLTGGR